MNRGAIAAGIFSVLADPLARAEHAGASCAGAELAEAGA
jgi:hypothetical protein